MMSAEPGQSKLRVVQLNIGSLFEPDWEQRQVEIVEWLVRLEPDVVAFQEVWESNDSNNTGALLGRLASERLDFEFHHAFGGFNFGSVMTPDPDFKFGSSVLSRWPIDSSNLTRLSKGPNDKQTGVGQELLHVSTAGLDIFSTHLSAAPHDGAKRRQQVVEIDAAIKAARGKKDKITHFGATRDAMPAVLCGDFNAEPDSDEIRFLSGLTPIDGIDTFYVDAWRSAGDGTAGLTQDWRENYIAASLNVHRKRIDYVFVGDAFMREGHAGRILETKVVFDEPLTGIVASDHTGLCVDICWPTRPAS